MSEKWRTRWRSSCNAMIIQLKKGRDGPSSLACVRDDGSRTWSKVHPFFPVHDLTHCAVESVLGFDQAFFGLVASGWNLDDVGGRGSAGRLPAQALWAEHIVGLLDLERANHRLFDAAEFNELLGAALGKGQLAPCRRIEEAELASVRQRRNALQQRWQALTPGETLEVEFPVSAGDHRRSVPDVSR